MASDAPPETNGVVVLLSTYNGARFLQAQLDSLLTQTHGDWRLAWRDDGSSDDTVTIMEAFESGPGAGRCARVGGPGRLGTTASFLTLLRAAQPGEVAAFADQDDVWLSDKIARGVAALAAPGGRPALYCARQMLVDEHLHEIGLSAPVRGPSAFPAALTQNVATGCTVMLNPAAVRMVAASRAPPRSLHDWWSYLVVTASGGALIADDQPTVLYRQHGGNVVGAPASRRARAMAALKRGPGLFMEVLRGHVAALEAQPDLLSPGNRATLDVIATGLAHHGRLRLRALRVAGLVRQTRAETLLFRVWFLIG